MSLDSFVIRKKKRPNEASESETEPVSLPSTSRQSIEIEIGNKSEKDYSGGSNEEIPSDSEAPTKKNQKIYEQKFRDEWKQSRKEFQEFGDFVIHISKQQE
ncbi:hypothetical protein JTB14_015096 [Gonioctena quinquepunctata]|nr:hypothetical protein JTB14_015096 [Gonioctena quinquepunctata]